MADVVRTIDLRVNTKKDEGPTRSTERVDELGDHASKTAVRLRVMGSSAKSAGNKLLRLAASATVASAALTKTSVSSQMLTRQLFKVHKSMMALGGILGKIVTGGLKMATLAMGAMSIALVGIHVLFIAGKFLVKAYNLALQGLASGAAGATVAIGLMAAAIREQQAAQVAYTGKGNAEFGSGLRQAQVHMRGLHADTELASAGAEALNKVYAEIANSKHGYDTSSKALLKGLGDFAAAGQPLSEGLGKASAVVIALQDKKKGFGAVQEAAKGLGPAMVKAMEEAKKKGIDTKEEFIEAMKDGQLSLLGGVTGQMDAVNGTLVGQFQKYFNLIRVRFADFGQQFLPQAKVALEKIFNIFNRTMAATSGALAAPSRYIDMMVNATQKVADFYVKLIHEYLPASYGMLGRVGDWWDNFKSGWRNVTEALRPFLEGSAVIQKTFGNAWRPIWNEISSNAEEFNRSVQRNAPAFEAFGTTVGIATAQLFKLLNMFQRVITNNLPFISSVVRALGNMVEQFMSMFGFLSKMFGDKGAIMALLGMSRALKTTRGTLVDKTVNTQNMNVKAGKVSIMGGIKGALEGAKVGKLLGPKGMAIGAVVGGVTGSGAAGPEAKEAWEKSGGAAAKVLSIKGIAGRLGLRSSGASSAATKSTDALDTVGKSSKKASGGLTSFRAALAGATNQLRAGLRVSGSSGGGIAPLMPGTVAPTGPSSPISPPPAGGPVARLASRITGKGDPSAPAGRFSRFSRGMAGIGGFGRQNQDKADTDAQGRRKPFGGMGGFAMGMGFSKLADKVDNPDVAAGLNLAATTSMFSPKMGLGVAGGTMAMNSENGLAAMGGGAVAGAAIGSEFGKAGMVVGAVIGTVAGFIMAPLTAVKKAGKEAQGVVDNFFQQTTGNIMVNMARMEYENKERLGEDGGDSTVFASLKAAQARMNKISKIAGKGAEGGRGAKSRSYGEFVGGATAMGAGLGAFVGTTAGLGVGVAPGTVVGGAAGFVAGNAMYGIDRIRQAAGNKKERNKERKGAINDLYAEGVLTESEFKRATSKKKKRFARDDEVDENYQQQLLERLAKGAEAHEKAFASAEGTMKARVDLIGSVTGMAETDIIALAQSMNVNLADATGDFNEQLLKLGVTIIKTAADLDDAISKIMANRVASVYESAIRQEQAPHIINDMMKKFRTDYDSRSDKSISVQDAGQIIGTSTEQLTALYGGDSSRAYFETVKQFGSPDGRAFDEFNSKGERNVLGGLGEEFYKGKAGQANTKVFADMEKDVIKTMTPQLGAMMAKTGKGFSDATTMATIQERLAGMGVNEQERFFDMVSNGDLEAMGGLDTVMNSFGMGDLVGEGKLMDLDKNQQAFAAADSNLEKEGILLDAQLKVTADMGKFFGEDSENPEWWSVSALRSLFIDAGLKDADTSSPRGKGIGDTTSSRLQETLSRHRSMDSMISGKRMITSSYRTNNLGSINSDHLTGRAYDLVGNQLGMYKTTVEKNGGFAEYHGGSANRHLHVVPGAGPMGDTTVPSYSATPTQSSAPMQNSSASGGMVINLNVNGIGIKEAIPQIEAALKRAVYETENRS